VLLFERGGFSLPLFPFASEFGEGFFHALEFGVFQTVYAAEAVVEEFRVIRVVGGVGGCGGIQERHQFVFFAFVEIGSTVGVVIILPFFVVLSLNTHTSVVAWCRSLPFTSTRSINVSPRPFQSGAERRP